MKIEEVKNEEMYCLFAPDGSWQSMTLSPDFATCVAVLTMLYKYKLSEPLPKLLKQGFKIMPIKVTFVQNGDENKAFNKNG